MMTSIHYPVFEAAEKDLPSMKELLIETGLKPTIEIGDNSIYYFISASEQKIAMIGAELSGNAALIRSTAVLNTYRKNGLAAKLIQTLFKELSKKKIEHLFLFSKDTGPFWQKFGFVQCPVENVIRHLPDSPQVNAYLTDNSIWSDVAWQRIL